MTSVLGEAKSAGVPLAGLKEQIRIPYALRRVPGDSFARRLPCPKNPRPGDIVLARVESIGKNGRLELASGRLCTLHEGDLIAAVFGNRYATHQFEGYARLEGERCDLLSMGGLCGLVESRHASVAAPTRLSVLGALSDASGRPLHLRDFSLRLESGFRWPRVVVVCGSSMDAGKSYTAASIITALKGEHRVAGIKLTGTAAGRDTWGMLDAGAHLALDFVDGGYGSTYLCTTEELLELYHTLISYAASRRSAWAVVELADGVTQRETAALLQAAGFTSTVDGWVLAATDSLAAMGGVELLRRKGIEPAAISGLVSMSALAMREVQAAANVPCLTAQEIRGGGLSRRLVGEPADATRWALKGATAI